MARDLKREVETLVTSLAEIRRALADLPDQIETVATASRKRIGQATEDVADRARDGVEAIEGEISTHPLLAVGLAFLAGVAFDRFLLRK
jgi:ElaB/YqjD/DUF883 family membrane-anchored ribosome-binding protein